MELAVLNSSYKRSRLIENWNSLVWTERYSTNGDFQLVSNHISDILEQLPLGGPLDPPTLVNIEGSTVPMVVESHKIEKPKNGINQIVTTGRSFETVLDRRLTVYKTAFADPAGSEVAGFKRQERRISANNAAVAAYEVIKDIIIDGDAAEVGVDTMGGASDLIPEISLFNGYGSSGTAAEYPVEAKELYAWVLETLALGPVGIGKFGFKAALPVDPATTISLIIYAGTDRSAQVAFDVALDQFDQASYLLSHAGYKNVMVTSAKERIESSTLLGSEPTGLARRVGYLNLESEMTVPNTTTGLSAALVNRGKVALSKLAPIALFAGGVSRDIGEGYNDTYFLGDIVKLQGEYGLSQNARIAEFVRTEDTTGVKAYPTFEAVS